MEKKNEKTTAISLGTLYELNKMAVNKEKVLKQSIIDEKKKDILNFIKETKNIYYMLLSNEKKDFTIFKITNKIDDLPEILVEEVLKNRGAIKGIAITKAKDAFEIWMSIDGDSYVYYFFPYDAALVEV